MDKGTIVKVTGNHGFTGRTGAIDRHIKSGLYGECYTVHFHLPLDPNNPNRIAKYDFALVPASQVQPLTEKMSETLQAVSDYGYALTGWPRWDGPKLSAGTLRSLASRGLVSKILYTSVKGKDVYRWKLTEAGRYLCNKNEVICEECNRPIPERDISSFQSESNGAAGTPRLCEDCAEG